MIGSYGKKWIAIWTPMSYSCVLCLFKDFMLSTYPGLTMIVTEDILIFCLVFHNISDIKNWLIYSQLKQSSDNKLNILWDFQVISFPTSIIYCRYTKKTKFYSSGLFEMKTNGFV